MRPIMAVTATVALAACGPGAVKDFSGATMLFAVGQQEADRSKCDVFVGAWVGDTTFPNGTKIRLNGEEVEPNPKVAPSKWRPTGPGRPYYLKTTIVAEARFAVSYP
jgi:hypothetical protein